MSDPIWFTDCLVRAHVETEDHVVLEFLMPSGHRTPVHTHERVESVFVLEGELTVGTGHEVIVLRPGQGTAVRGGVSHQLTVTSAGASRALVVAEPAFARVVRDAGTPAERPALPTLTGPPDLDGLLAVGVANGMTFPARLSSAVSAPGSA